MFTSIPYHLSQNLPVILLALGFDILFGDPPSQWHPVAWIGSLISRMKAFAPASDNRTASFLFGGLMILLGSLLMGSAGLLITALLALLPTLVRWVLTAALLKTLFSFRMLTEAGMEIYSALTEGDLPRARYLVSWHLVSRDTSTLDESRTSAAAIESLAENTSDSIIAPLFYFALLGLPGALIYRFVNTSDAMVGYRDAEHEWLGKIPARTDDLLNLLPARLTALLFLASAAFFHNFHGAIQTWFRDRYKTESPNAGHPMSAAAGALSIELEKIGHYTLGEGNRKPEPADLLRMIRLLRSAAALMSLILIGCSIWLWVVV